MHLRVQCIKGYSYFKQRETYHLKIKKLNMTIRDLAQCAQKTCDPNLELLKQNKCKTTIDQLSYTIKKKNDLMKEYELFEQDWIQKTSDEEMIDDLKF